MASIKELLMEAALWGDAFLKAEQRKDAREAEKIKQELMLKTQELTNKINDQKLKLAQKEHERRLKEQQDKLTSETQEQRGFIDHLFGLGGLTSPPSQDQTESLTKSRVIGDEEKSLAESGVDTTAKTGAAVDLQESLQSAIAKPPEDIPANMQKLLQEQMQRQAQRAPVAERETARRRLPAPARGTAGAVVTAPAPTAVQAQPTATAPGALMPGVAAKTGVAPPTTKPETIDVTPYVDRAKEIPPKLRATDTVTEAGKEIIAGTTTDIPKRVVQSIEKEVGPLGKKAETVHTGERESIAYYGPGMMRNLRLNIQNKFGLPPEGASALAGTLMEAFYKKVFNVDIEFPGSSKYRKNQYEIRDAGKNSIYVWDNETQTGRIVSKGLDMGKERAPMSDIKAVMENFQARGIPLTGINYGITINELAKIVSTNNGLQPAPVESKVIEKGYNSERKYFTIERNPLTGEIIMNQTDIEVWPPFTVSDIAALAKLGIDATQENDMSFLKLQGIPLPPPAEEGYDKAQLIWADATDGSNRNQLFWAYNNTDGSGKNKMVPLVRDGAYAYQSKSQSDKEEEGWSVEAQQRWVDTTRKEYNNAKSTVDFREITHQFKHVLEPSRKKFLQAWGRLPVGKDGKRRLLDLDGKAVTFTGDDMQVTALIDSAGNPVLDGAGKQVFTERFKEYGPKWQTLNPATQAIIMSFNKILDYGSVVRESEYNRTGQGQGFWQKISGWLPRMKQGGVGLTADEVNGFYDIAKTVFKASEDAHKIRNSAIVNRTIDKGRVYNLSPFEVLPMDLWSLYGITDAIENKYVRTLDKGKRKELVGKMLDIIHPVLEETTIITSDPKIDPSGVTTQRQNEDMTTFIVNETVNPDEAKGVGAGQVGAEVEVGQVGAE